MSFDQNWPRWIKSSVFKFVSDANATGLKIFIEGTERKTSDLASYFELRMDGPWSQELSKDYWRLEVEVNVLCSAVLGKELYAIDRMMGEMTKILDAVIPVKKYGDDESQIGCLRLKTGDKYGSIESHYYGQIEPKIKLIQATVEARYWIELP